MPWVMRNIWKEISFVTHSIEVDLQSLFFFFFWDLPANFGLDERRNDLHISSSSLHLWTVWLIHIITSSSLPVLSAAGDINCAAKCERIEQCYICKRVSALRIRAKLCHKSQVSRSTRFTSPLHSLYLPTNFCLVVVHFFLLLLLLLNQHLLALLTIHTSHGL